MILLNSQVERPAHAHRGAFTLIEVLITIGIVALLATMLVMAMAPGVEGARITATKTTINQLNRMIQERVDALVNSRELQVEADRIKKIYDASNSSDMQKELAKTLALYKLYRNTFPQKIDDLYGLDRTPNKPDQFQDDSPIFKEMWDYQNDTWKTGTWGARNAAAKGSPDAQQRAESSELMYLLLNRSSAIERTSAINIDQINPKHIGDTDEDGNLEFLDDWGNPLQFYNWPTALFRNEPNAIAALTALFPSYNKDSVDGDPFDPTGEIVRRNLHTSPLALASGYNVGLLNADRFKEPNLFWAFLIVSGGPDDSVGLDLPAPLRGSTQLTPPSAVSSSLGTVQSQNLDAVYDNISNRQQQ